MPVNPALEKKKENAKLLVAYLQYSAALAAMYYLKNGQTYSGLKMAVISMYVEKFAVDLLKKNGTDEDIEIAVHLRENYSYLSRFSIYASDVATKMTHKALAQFKTASIETAQPKI